MINDEFERDVYCLLGLPVDAIDLAGAAERVRAAVRNRERLFISTPNLNWLIGCLADADFRRSVIASDLVLADGMPLIWIARLLGIYLPERVAGSNLFEALKQVQPGQRPIDVYFFGGPDGVAELASRRLNAAGGGVRAVGWQFPGFGSVEEMSTDAVIAQINASGADFLVVSLGARKGQEWLMRNRERLQVPVLCHLGAVVNFEAGLAARAPRWVQVVGLEWMWRIGQEPALWRRYWHDGLTLLRLLPVTLWIRLTRWSTGNGLGTVRFEAGSAMQPGRLVVAGAQPCCLSSSTRASFRAAAAAEAGVEVDLGDAEFLAPAFFAQLLTLNHKLSAIGRTIRFVRVTPRHQSWFRVNQVELLLRESRNLPGSGL